MPPNVPRPEAVLRGHAGEVQALDFDAAERFLVSGDSLGEVRVWDLRDLRPASMRRLHPLTGGILSLRLFRSGGRQLLGTQGRDGAAHLWECGEQLELLEEPVRSFISDCYSFCRFSVLPPEPPLCSAAEQGQAGGGSGAPQQDEQQRQAAEFVAAVLGGAGAEPAAGSSDAPADAAPAAPAGEDGAASRLAAEGAAAASTAPSYPAAAAIWGLHPCPRASAEQPPALLALPGGDERTAEIVCCECGASLAAFREEAAGRKLGMLMAVQLYCLPPAAAGSTATPAAGSGGPAGGGCSGCSSASHVVDKTAAAARAAVRPPRVCLAAGYEGGSLVLWDAAAPGAPLAQRQLCTEPVMALALHPCPCNPAGGTCGSAEHSAVVFKLDHSAQPARISVSHKVAQRREGIGDAAVRPDGKLLVTAGWDGRVRVYQYRSGRALAVLKYHTSPVTGLRFAPRSMLLATAARDGTLALWPLYQPEPA